MFAFLITLTLIGFFTLAWKDLKSAIFVLLALLPAYLIRFSLGPFPTTLLELLLLIVMGIWLVRHKGYRVSVLRGLGPYRIPALLLFAAACFGVVVAPNTFAALGIWKAYYLEPLLFFLVIRYTLKDRDDWKKALQYLSLAVLVIGVFSILQVLFHAGIPYPWITELRATSIFDYPNAVGLFVAPIVSALAIFLAKEKTSWQERALFAGTILVGGVACILSQTEAAYVAIPGALFVTFLFTDAARKKKLAALIFGGVLFFALFAMSGTVREKLLLQDYSGQVRLTQWKETAQLLLVHPIFGAGLSGYPEALVPYHDPRIYEIFQYPHTLLLNFWVELGLLGVISLFGFVLFGAKTMHFRREDAFSLAGFAALLTMVIHGLVDVPFFKNDLAVLTAFFLAMSLVFFERSKKDPQVK